MAGEQSDRRAKPPEIPAVRGSSGPRPETVGGWTREQYEADLARSMGPDYLEQSRTALDGQWEYMVETFGDPD